MRPDISYFENAARSLKALLEEEYSDLLEDGLADVLEEKTFRWMLETETAVSSRYPYSQQQYAYENCGADHLKKRTTVESLIRDVSRCDALSDASKEQWIEECRRPRTDIISLQEKLLGIWKDYLERISAKWYLDSIELKRSEFADSMESWLRFIQAAKESMDGMGIGHGLLWDLSPGDGGTEDRSVLLEWSGRIGTDPNLRNLCEQLGHEMLSSRTSSEQLEVPRSTEYLITDRTASEEFAGVETGHRVEDLLPSELGSIDDPELGILFELKYAEDRLACFSKQGYTSVESEISETVQVEKDDDGFAGPVILCIDTSGSMIGTPEYIAKGVALYIAMRAHAEKRSCYLISFSRDIETLDLTPEHGLSTLLSFIEEGFHGGTDIKPALIAAIEKLDDEEYRKADVLTISDFIVPPDSLDFLRKEVGEEKDRKCRFHSLTVGSFPYTPAVSEIFDVAWQYNPATNNIKKLE